jgi:hypothetical protein|nr:MAG TPA: hypothetical protein [Caudoviricetes sp.]
MRTKEPKRYDYLEMSRKSIRKDFQNVSFRRQGREPRAAASDGYVKRVVAMNERSSYAEFRRFFLGKLVRILRPGIHGGYYVEFVKDEDRKSLNANAGWSSKREYLLDGVKFD